MPTRSAARLLRAARARSRSISRSMRIFTKADLIAGFNEFFGALTEPQRRMVWGHSFQTADKTRNMIGDVPLEYDALIERLNERLPDRLQDEHNPNARALIFGFPSQMATLKHTLVEFLDAASSSRRAIMPMRRCAASISPPARRKARRSTSSSARSPAISARDHATAGRLFRQAARAISSPT